jgi:hypothetical protein
MSITLLPTKPTDKIFIEYATGGKLTLDDCLLSVYGSFEEVERGVWKTWNGTFIRLTTGSFFIKNTEIKNVFVSGDKFVVTAVLSNNKQFEITNSKFINCGCVDSGKVIYVSSGSSTSGTFGLSVTNTQFTSCSCVAGGALYVDGIVSLTVTNSKFEDCEASGSGREGGGVFCLLS